MTRWIAGLIAAVGIAGVAPALAQETVPGPGAVVVTIIPGGGTFFTESKDTGRTSFGNYDLGAGVTVHLNRYIGIEGEVAGAVGTASSSRHHHFRRQYSTRGISPADTMSF